MSHLEDRCSQGNRGEPAPQARRRPGPGQAVGWAETAGAEHPCCSGAGHMRAPPGRPGPMPTGKKARGCSGHAHKGTALRLGGFAVGRTRGRASEGSRGRPGPSSGRARGEGPVPPPALVQLALPAGLWRVVPPTRARCTNLSRPRAGGRAEKAGRERESRLQLRSHDARISAGWGQGLDRARGGGGAGPRPPPPRFPPPERRPRLAPLRRNNGAGPGPGRPRPHPEY